MIKNWLIRGDCHGEFTWLCREQLDKYEPETTGIIILGDAGLNFYLNKTDARVKKEVDAKGFYLYVVRGNHEARPHDLKDITLCYDENVQGNVWIEPAYPHIRYFCDWGVYVIGGYKVAVIGGAYSVDKYWRLTRFGLTEETNIPKKTGWFANEQLTAEEMSLAEKEFMSQINLGIFDFVFSHTCPMSYEPTDMFLGSIDQKTVDTSMETWMENLKNKFTIKYAWLFGHFHADRIEAPHVEMYFKDIEDLEVIADRWTRYDKTGELDWWLVKGPQFYLHNT